MRKFNTGRILLWMVAMLVWLPVSAQTAISDIVAAREWCDANMLHRVEGIWEFPEDETTVLVCRSNITPHRYDIIVVSSPDTRLTPGETVGYLHESADSDKFEMALYRTKLEGTLKEPGKCLATLRDNDNSIVAQGRKAKFSLRTWSILPSFWRMVRMSVNDPLENLPKGMLRVYPSSSRQPDYL